MFFPGNVSFLLQIFGIVPIIYKKIIICTFISDKYRVPVKAWVQGGVPLGSDTDSASGSSKSVDSSPSNSPYPSGHKKMGLSGSMEDLIEGEVPSGVKNLLAVPGTETMDVHSIMKVSISFKIVEYGLSKSSQRMERLGFLGP